MTASVGSSVDELNQLMTEYGIRHLPITQDGKVVGVVSERDLKVVAGLDVKDRSLVLARDIMVRDPVTVNSTTPLSEVAFEMSKRKIGSVIVNEQDKFLGIFTVTDALNALIEITRAE